MSRAGQLLARASYAAVTGLPSGRARTAALAPILELGFAAVGAPLSGRVVRVAHGPAAGLAMVGERRSLAWLSGRTEAAVQDVLVRHLRLGSLVVDVGASIGFHSLLAARLVGASGAVVAVEPQPAAASSIRRNATINGLTWIAVVEAAAGRAGGRGALVGLGRATARVSAEAEGRPDAPRVEILTIDELVAGRPAPTLVKVDVEGAELDVLAGMTRVLQRGVDAVVVECHADDAKVRELLGDFGYAVTALAAGSDPRGRHVLGLPRVAPGP